jgi:hypothetical protein
VSPLVRRHLPAASSPVSADGLLGGMRAVLAPGGGAARRQVEDALRALYAPRALALTDSGTSALVMALRLAAGEGGTVAYPGYSCVDLAAAARYAGVRVRLYDLDPRTLGPDLGALERALERGVNAVVVAHLYGFPADVPAVCALARRFGVPVIEDAAQGAGGSLHGVRLGALGDLSVLSFGRGKGTTGGRGGAIMARDARLAAALDDAAQAMGEPAAGWASLGATAAQWALGRPSLYAIPASIPALRLGEMVYHPAHEPAPLPRSAAGLLRSALALDAAELSHRRANARALGRLVATRDDLLPVRELSGADPGFLRLPVLDLGSRNEAPALGVMRGYPRTLLEQQELRPSLAADEPATPGAQWLRERLFTLPTHGLLAPTDLEAVGGWIGAPTARHPFTESDLPRVAERPERPLQAVSPPV